MTHREQIDALRELLEALLADLEHQASVLSERMATAAKMVDALAQLESLARAEQIGDVFPRGPTQ